MNGLSRLTQFTSYHPTVRKEPRWSLGGCVSRSFLSPSLVTPTRLRLFVWDGNGRSMRPVTSSVAHSRSAHSLMLHSCRSNRSKRSERRMRETRVNHPRWDKGRSFGPARRGWWTAMSDNHSSYDWAVSDSERRGSSVKGNGADERSPISSVNKESSFPPFTSLPRGRSGSRLMNLGSWLCRENHVIPTFSLIYWVRRILSVLILFVPFQSFRFDSVPSIESHGLSLGRTDRMPTFLSSYLSFGSCFPHFIHRGRASPTRQVSFLYNHYSERSGA